MATAAPGVTWPGAAAGMKTAGSAFAVACLSWLAVPAAAQDACGLVPWAVARDPDPFSAYIPHIDSAQSLPKEGVFALKLRPVADVIYPVAPARGSDSGKGGIVTLEYIPAGRYRIVLSEVGWVDAVQDNKRLPILASDRATNCPGTRESVQVEVKSEPLTLQIGGVKADHVNIAVLRLWPFEWKW
ncbi:hypothetical protein [Enhydrobacter sp.]|uniref:hypothetical protein n=1 Tax=Enhydrobacter sp. TaxID=1894999 RepID=UPI002607CFCC|nr:hypothetical protein [Enhydrobacter sp.]